MAKFLRDLLDGQEPMFSNAILKLEQATGRDSVDVRLIADMTIAAHGVMRRLSLDPADTEARELYGALNAHAEDDSLFAATSYVGILIKGEPISLNQTDARENVSKPYEQRTNRNMRCHLQQELVSRYMNHERTDERMVQEFAHDAGLDICSTHEFHNEESTIKGETNMTHILSELLEAEEPIFTQALDQLSTVSGNTSASNDLTAEIDRKINEGIGQLGLDEHVSGEDFYKALMQRMEADNERVTRLIGGTDSSDVADLVPRMIEAANNVQFDRNVFVLKHDKARDFLRQMPPEKLMAKLGYDNVETMFENEDFDEIYTALRFSEGEEWLNSYNELFKTVTPEDYEERDIRILTMDHDKYVDLAEHFTQKKLHNVTHTKELGVIVIVPLRDTHSKGLTLKTLPLLLHYLNEVKLYSDFFKFKASQPDFGNVVVATLIADPGGGNQNIDGNIHWRVIQRYFGKLKAESPSEAYEPHVHPEDLHWRRAENLLCQIDPAMAFWQDMDYVGRMYDGRPIVLNFVDITLSYANSMSYAERYVYHMRESLWNEIFMRYMGKANLESQILQQLDNDMIAPELLTVGKDS